MKEIKLYFTGLKHLQRSEELVLKACGRIQSSNVTLITLTVMIYFNINCTASMVLLLYVKLTVLNVNISDNYNLPVLD